MGVGAASGSVGALAAVLRLRLRLDGYLRQDKRRKGRVLGAVCAGVMLAGCDPQAAADGVARAAARSVVVPVVGQYLPGPEAEIAATCVIDNASAQEIQSLARDVGTRAGTSTVATVLAVAQRPGTLRCLLERGVAPLPRGRV